MATETAVDTTAVVDYILGDQKSRYTGEEIELIARAYEFAAEAHASQKRRSGEPYVTHCIEVCKILVELVRDPSTLAAGLLHDTIEDCGCTVDELAAKFSPTIAELVDSVTKISSIKAKQTRAEQLETLRKLIITMARDLRVIIIKLADRTHNLRTLDFLPPDKQERIARDSLDVFAPLAGRLGMARVKGEIEDLSMKYLYPDAYGMLKAKVDAERTEYEAVVKDVITALTENLKKAGIEAEINGRTKHLYSIWRKMQRQEVSLEGVYDIMAVRVICESDDPACCYNVLGMVHNTWTPIVGRFRDFIAVPRANGYQSLHTTVLVPENHRVEIQIRTREMHRVAEEGVAAHWKYKEGIRGEMALEQRLIWLRRLVDWVKDVHDPNEFFDSLKNELRAESVFCFTPRGDIIELPAGATPLDFAYYIHTSVGEKCEGALVNKRMVPLTYELQTGDVVEIKTSAKAHPTRRWLEIVHTSRARTKVRHWLRQRQWTPENIQRGKDALAKALRARNITVSWDEVQSRLAPTFKHYQVQNFDELCAEIAVGGVQASSLIGKVFGEAGKTSRAAKARDKRPHQRATSSVIVGDLEGALVRFAACCAPVPGDKILGFITSGRGVTIHRAGCSTVQRFKNDPVFGARLVDARWNSSTEHRRLVGLRIICEDRDGLLADLSSAITNSGVFILGCNSVSRGDKATIAFTVEVKNLAQLDNLQADVRHVKSVLAVKRQGTAKVSP
jgi:GTP pyrophosphokinase